MIENYEEVDVYPLDPEVQEQLLQLQNECAFVWGPKDHWAVGVMMSYVWRDGRFWLTATSQRKRIAAIRRDSRVSVVVSSVGTPLGPAKTVTAKGRCILHEDQETKDWFYPALAAAIMPVNEPVQKAFAKMKGTVLVGASKMKVTMDFTGEDLVMSVGKKGKPGARVAGSMDTLLGVALGKGMVGPVLSGKLKIGGKAWRLLRMLKLMKAEATQ